MAFDWHHSDILNSGDRCWQKVESAVLWNAVHWTRSDCDSLSQKCASFALIQCAKMHLLCRTKLNVITLVCLSCAQFVDLYCAPPWHCAKITWQTTVESRLRSWNAFSLFSFGFLQNCFLNWPTSCTKISDNPCTCFHLWIQASIYTLYIHLSSLVCFSRAFPQCAVDNWDGFGALLLSQRIQMWWFTNTMFIHHCPLVSIYNVQWQL